MTRSAILREQQESESRVVNEADRARLASIAGEKMEISAAMDKARRALAHTQPPTDHRGVPFAVGQSVTTLTELWFSRIAGVGFVPVGTRGVIAGIGVKSAIVNFPNMDREYAMATDRMRVVLETLP